MRTRIERLDFADRPGAEVSNFIYAWKNLRKEGWDVTVLCKSTMRRGLRSTVAVIALAFKD